MTSISATCEQRRTEKVFLLYTGDHSYIFAGKEYQLTSDDIQSSPLDRRLAHTTNWLAKQQRPGAYTFLHFYPSTDEPIRALCREFTLDNHSPGRISVTVDPEISLDDSRFKKGFDPEILDNLSQSLLVTEADRPAGSQSRRIVHVNKGFEDLYGYAATDIIGESPTMLWGELTEPASLSKINEHIESWTPCTVEITTYRKDHTIIKAEIHLVPIRDETGWWTHWLAFQRDLGREREIEKRLARQEFILKSLGVGLWRLNVTRGLLEWDAGMFKVYGQDESSFHNRLEDWVTYLHPDEQHRVDDLEGEVVSKTDTDNDVLFRVITNTGEERIIAARAEHMQLPEGDEEGDEIIYGINWNRTTEITLQKEFEAQRDILERRERLANMGELASGIGHEIRNPLQIAISYIDQALHRKPGSALSSDVRGDLDKAQASLQQIAAIADALRNSGRADYQDVETFDVNGLIYEHLALVKPVFKRSEIAISTQLEASPLWIKGSRSRLLQVLMNLSSNSRDALAKQKNREITISTARCGAAVHIEVGDNGPGITGAVREKIFKEAITSKNYGEGSGLGLQISKKILADLGGSIRLAPDVQSGATFVIEIPLCEPPPEIAGLAPTAKTPAKYVASVLLVDDEDDIRAILRRQIEQIGIQVHEASGVDAALAVLTQMPDCDLIICDLNMPKRTGDQLLRELKEKCESHPRFVLLTGSAEQEIENQVAPLRTDIEKILRKPFRFKDLEPILRHRATD